MKKFILLIICLFITGLLNVNSASVVYNDNGKFGLKNENGDIIKKAEYKKMIKLGDGAWIYQDGTKFGIIREDGYIVVKPIYNQAERILGKYAKFRKGDKYGIYDEMGFEILPVEFSSIDLLYGGMFVTCKNYLYGATDLNGQIILDNIFDDIYTPEVNKLIIVYQGKQLTIEKEKDAPFTEPFNTQDVYNYVESSDYEIDAITATGYYSVTLTDYILKLFSSISPAYEQTIDELVYSQGADTVNVLMKFTWLPKFPFVYAKKYFNNIIEPYNGPLGDIKRNIKTNN